ncbi:MAG: LEA type 2 family protein, partial [candidate division NC10 bacterium]
FLGLSAYWDVRGPSIVKWSHPKYTCLTLLRWRSASSSSDCVYELRILNPNDFALEVTGLDFQLDVNGIQLARGLSNEEITVPRLGESIVSVMTSTTVLDIVRQIENLSQQQEMSYEIRGRFHLGNAAVGSVPFERSAKYTP